MALVSPQSAFEKRHVRSRASVTFRNFRLATRSPVEPRIVGKSDPRLIRVAGGVDPPIGLVEGCEVFVEVDHGVDPVSYTHLTLPTNREV